MAIQTDYARDPAIGKPGLIARPNLPYWVEVGEAQVDSNERKPRPGDGVIWDDTANGFKIPGTAAEQVNIVGIVAHRDQEIARANTTTDTAVQYDDGDLIYVITLGVVYLRVENASGVTVSRGDRLTFPTPSTITDDGGWTAVSAATSTPPASPSLANLRAFLAAQPPVDIVAQNEDTIAASSSGLILAKIGMGR